MAGVGHTDLGLGAAPSLASLPLPPEGAASAARRTRRAPLRRLLGLDPLLGLVGLLLVAVAVCSLVVARGLAHEPGQAAVAIYSWRAQPDGTWPSYNSQWVGRAVQPAHPRTGAYRSVSGTWAQPTIAVPSSGEGSVSTWVGMDGAGAGPGTVEQVGTTVRYEPSQGLSEPHVEAWWEMDREVREGGRLVVPPDAYPHPIAMSISPGDEMAASVTYLGHGEFRLSLRDLTAAASAHVSAPTSWTGAERAAGPTERSSIEWVDEVKGSSPSMPEATPTVWSQTAYESQGAFSQDFYPMALHDPFTGQSATVTTPLSARGAFSVTFSGASDGS